MTALSGLRGPVLEIENEWIPLADGTRLGARIWVPREVWTGEAAPVPAVLEYLPYRKDDGTAVADARRHPYFARRGYASVRVDIRGTGDSDGLLRGEYLPQEQDDALEVLAWLASQPWCSGRVGMIGYSWGGFNGLQIAARRPPELGAVITVASTDDRYLDDCHYMGGCLLGSDMLKWASTMLTYPLQPPDPRFVGDRWRRMWRDRLEHAPELARDWVSHQLRDEFWKHGSVAEDYGAIQCPVFVVGGWADAYTNAVPRLMEHLRVPRLGLIGPWGHMMPHEGVPGPAIAFLEQAVRWWDRWLKGIENGIMDEPPIRVWLQDYVKPATFHAVRPGRWVGIESWPPPDAFEQPVPLTGGGSRSVIRGRQECGEAAGVWCANGFRDEIAGDQGPDDRRSLCFTSRPLAAPVEVLGYPQVRLSVDADRSWGAVAARLEDVAPDGQSLLVSWGLLNLTHRGGHEWPVVLEPGTRYEVTVMLRVCGHRFSPGHRIRLALSPTYWPHVWPSPEVVTLGVWMDGASVLVLPVLHRTRAAEVTGGVAADEVVATGDRAGSAEATARDERTRTISGDPASGAHEIRDREVHERVIPATGALYREEAVDVYTIVEDEPLSATVRCWRRTRSEREGWRWRVEVEAEMTCDEGHFHLREEYAAFEGDAEVFRATRAHRIPRLMV